MTVPDTSTLAKDVPEFLMTVHERLSAHYDIDRWHWREETAALDICLGAILVQHTAWTNVERAVERMYEAGVDTLERIVAVSEEELALLVRPAGTPLTKARRLQTFASLALAHGGFTGLFSVPAQELRSILLATNGIGPETADVILLYGARLPAIVHDAYTARLFRRLGTGPERDGYERWQSWLDARLPVDGAYRRAHHAAIVVHCKLTCRTRPKCTACPLLDLCECGQSLVSPP